MLSVTKMLSEGVKAARPFALDTSSAKAVLGTAMVYLRDDTAALLSTLIDRMLKLSDQLTLGDVPAPTTLAGSPESGKSLTMGKLSQGT